MDADHLQRFLDETNRMRAAYDLPPLTDLSQPAFPTLTQMKAAEHEHMLAAATQIVRAHGGRRSCAEPLRVFYRHSPVHDRDLPAFAHLVIDADALTAAAVPELVRYAWTGPEWPEANLDSGLWRAMFHRAGYLTDDGPTDRPSGPQGPLWRGATHSRRLGMAWTADRDRAVWFADRFGTALGDEAHVWRLDAVRAGRVLARFDGRGEAEVVVNTRGLDPQQVPR
jgi:hypothetical protein